jgi:hypothetical protein
MLYLCSVLHFLNLPLLLLLYELLGDISLQVEVG